MDEPTRDPFDDRLDEALRRRFEPPDAGRILTEAQRRAQAEESRRRVLRWPVIWRVAAAVALLLFGAWVVHFALNAGGPEPVNRYAQRGLEQVYQDDLAAGFEPLWVCETDHEFARTFAQRLGQPLLMAQGPASIQALGLSYANAISGGTTYLLAKVDGESVLVFVDRVDRDPGQAVTSGKLHLHRRELGELVLYELSPFDQPRVFDLFYVPDEVPPPPSE